MSKYSKNNSFPCPLPLTLYCDCKQPATIARIYLDTKRGISFRPTFSISDRPFERVNDRLYEKQSSQLVLDCPEVFKFKSGIYCISFPYALSNAIQTFSPAQLAFTVLNSNSFMIEPVLLGTYRDVFPLADKTPKVSSYLNMVHKDDFPTLATAKSSKSQAEFPPLSLAKKVTTIKSNIEAKVETKSESKIESKKEAAPTSIPVSTPAKKILKHKNEPNPSSAIKGIPEAPKILLKKKT